MHVILHNYNKVCFSWTHGRFQMLEFTAWLGLLQKKTARFSNNLGTFWHCHILSPAEWQLIIGRKYTETVVQKTLTWLWKCWLSQCHVVFKQCCKKYFGTPNTMWPWEEQSLSYLRSPLPRSRVNNRRRIFQYLIHRDKGCFGRSQRRRML